MEGTNSPKCMKIEHSHTFAYIFHSSSNYVSQYRQRLMDSQVIVDAGYGKVTFSLPFMREFLLELAELYEIDD